MRRVIFNTAKCHSDNIMNKRGKRLRFSMLCAKINLV